MTPPVDGTRRGARRPGAARRWLLPGAAAAMLALELVGLGVQRDWQVLPFVAVVLGQGVAFAVAVAASSMGRTAPLWPVLAVAALLRAGPLVGPVIWSSDINRYVWDGRVQAAGFNPYCCLPVDPRLASLRDPVVWPQINRAATAPTIYPPVAQMAFRLGEALGGTRLAFKAMFVAAEALGIWAMLRLLRRQGLPPGQVMLYAWHPLPIWEIAGSGHLDALIVAFLPLALLAGLAGRRGLAGAALGAAVLVKFLPLAAAPALWRPWRPDRDWRLPAAAVLLCVAAYLPYLGVGTRVLGYLAGYAEEERIAPGEGGGVWVTDVLRRLTGVAVPASGYLVLAALVLGGLALLALRRPRAEAFAPGEEPRWAAILAMAEVLALSPHYAWYFVWPLALVAATSRPWWPALWPAATAPLLYVAPVGGGIRPWTGGVIYGGFALLSLGEAAWRGRRRDPHRTIRAARAGGMRDGGTGE